MRVIRIRSLPAPPPRTRSKVLLSHDSRCSLATHPYATRAERDVDAGPPVSPAVLLEHCRDMHCQLPVCKCSGGALRGGFWGVIYRGWKTSNWIWQGALSRSFTLI